MAYRLPNFNLLCNIWGPRPTVSLGIAPVGPPRIANQQCQLAVGRVVEGSYVWYVHLQLPPLTDVRSLDQPVGTFDTVEVPAGTGRYYVVFAVDDVGKGFTNEYRTCSIAPQQFIKIWPIPIP